MKQILKPIVSMAIRGSENTIRANLNESKLVKKVSMPR